MSCAGRCKRLGQTIEPTCPPVISPTANPLTTSPGSLPSPPTTESVVGYLASAAVGVLVAIFLLVLITSLIYNLRQRDNHRLRSPGLNHSVNVHFCRSTCDFRSYYVRGSLVRGFRQHEPFKGLKSQQVTLCHPGLTYIF